MKLSKIVFTGGPCGGKTTLIQELIRDLFWMQILTILPEAIFVAGQTGISPSKKQFQQLMVEIQQGLEDALAKSLTKDDPQWILCHRGTLDPLAYWLERGWEEAEFYSFTETTRDEHYGRYTAVIHLVTVADGAASFYRRQPYAHRPETIEQAIHLDHLLHQVWRDHPHYYRLDNNGRDWANKAQAARDILERYRRE